MPMCTDWGARVDAHCTPCYRCNEAVTAPGDRLDAAPIQSPLIEHPTKRRDLHSQVTVVDHGFGPDGGEEVVFRDDLTRPLDQHAENVERTRADRDGDEGAIIIVPKQTAAPIEPEALEQKQLRGNEPLHTRPPAAASEARARRAAPIA